MKGFDYSKLKGFHYKAYTRVLCVIDMRTSMVIEFSHNQILFNPYLDGHKIRKKWRKRLGKNCYYSTLPMKNYPLTLIK